jgi:hypothetical protein
VLQAALDDSGKDGLSASFTLAGYFASAKQLMDLADDWKDVREQHPIIEYVKGYEAFGLHTQFEGWNETVRDKRLLEFVDLIRKHQLKGIAFVIDNKAFSLIKDLRDDDGNYFKDPYNFAYLMSLSFFLQALPDFAEGVADIVFDYDVISRRQAASAYKKIKYEPNWKELAGRLLRPEPHWESDRDFLPLQASDLLAYCVRAERDHGKRRDRVMRSAVLPALKTIPTGIAVIEEKQLRYLRDRKEKRIPRQSIFTMTKWQ